MKLNSEDIVLVGDELESPDGERYVVEEVPCNKSHYSLITVSHMVGKKKLRFPRYKLTMGWSRVNITEDDDFTIRKMSSFTKLVLRFLSYFV